MSGIVSELVKLLGEPVVFINWPKGVKGTKRKWGCLTEADMTPQYLAKLPEGNIGVALGEKSGGLCAVDLDLDELVEPFLNQNPALRNTLQTHGARGRVFWLRCKGDYPKRTLKFKTPSGDDAGEFRSNGGQSIIWGIHPSTHRPYEFVIKKRVSEVDFNSILWPEGIVYKPTLTNCTEEQKKQKLLTNRSTEELMSCGCIVGSPFYSPIDSIEDALRISIPTKKRENNALLFKLARAIKTLEIKGKVFDIPRLRTVFDEWYKRATPFLREGQAKEAYYFEFMNACQRAKYPLGGAKVADAWAKAKAEPLPKESANFDNPEIKLLIAFFKQLQAINGAEPFYITYRDCAALMGHKTHSTIVTWFGALAKLGYIRIAQAGNERKATRYHYVWKP